MSTELGARAEELAADYLESLDFTILGRNHRTRWSELDIVAEKDGTIHMIEVKYRSNPNYGTGFEYITADKLGRLTRAAEALMAHRDQPYQIDVVAVSGDLDHPSLNLIENITA